MTGACGGSSNHVGWTLGTHRSHSHNRLFNMLNAGKDTMLQTRSTPPLDADEIEASADRIPSLSDALAVIEATEILDASPDGLDPFDDGASDDDDAFTAFLVDSLVVVS